jgi:hypothetical protein
MKRNVKDSGICLARILMCLLAVALPSLLNGQAGVQKRTEKSERIQKKLRIQLDYFNTNNEEYTIRATVKTKEGRSYVTVEGALVMFTVAEENGDFDAVLGEVVSDEGGVAQITGNLSELPSTGIITFKAAIAESADFKKYARKLEVRNAVMAVEYASRDSTNLIKVRCSLIDSAGQDTPISDLVIKVYVERLFGELPVSTKFNETDDSGRTEILFPHNVHGNTEGQLVIVVRVEDSEEYGNLVNRSEISWGIPLPKNGHLHERLLWAAKYNAPVPLVIIVNGVLIAVWGMILYIVLNVVKIFRIGKATKEAIQT